MQWSKRLSNTSSQMNIILYHCIALCCNQSYWKTILMSFCSGQIDILNLLSYLVSIQSLINMSHKMACSRFILLCFTQCVSQMKVTLHWLLIATDVFTFADSLLLPLSWSIANSAKELYEENIQSASWLAGRENNWHGRRDIG